MSVSPVQGDRQRPAEAIAGFLAAAAIFLSLVAIVYRPIRLLPFAIVIGLIAAGIGGRYSRLAAIAIAVAGVSFFLGMTVAVLTNHPLF